MIDENKLDEMMRIASANNVNESEVKNIMNSLNEEDKKKVNDILNNKEKLNKILKNSNLKSLLNKFGNGNG